MQRPLLQTIQSMSVNSRTASITVRANFVLETKNSVTTNMSASSVKVNSKVMAHTGGLTGESMSVNGKAGRNGPERNIAKTGN